MIFLAKVPQRIQRRRVKGWRMPQNTIYVGRGSKWGSPFIVGPQMSLDESLLRYGDWVRCQVALSKLSWDELLDADYLACWCPLTQGCHVDVLVGFLQAIRSLNK